MHGSRTKHGRRRAAREVFEVRGGHGPGPGHHGRGHRARRGDVRNAILALLGERPMHGYEMIQELEERTAGRWVPSAGSIYPTLQLLEDEGLVKAEELDGRRTFSLTPSGEKAVKERGEAKNPWENGDEDSPRYELRAEAMRLLGAVKQFARSQDDDEELKKAVEILKQARKGLYGILADE